MVAERVSAILYFNSDSKSGIEYLPHHNQEETLAEVLLGTLAQDIHNWLSAPGNPSALSYDDYEPSDNEFFITNITSQFGMRDRYSADELREALEQLKDQHLVDIYSEQDTKRSESGGQGQPYPKKFRVTVSLR